MEDKNMSKKTIKKTQIEYQVSIRKVHEGTWLVADDGFTCIPEGKYCCVRRDRSTTGPWKHTPWNSRARLYVCCDEGQHYLDGQLDDAGTHYVGFKLSAC
jgi:hypothetical protein